jgi:lysophospholipase L1-like esterase
VAPGARRLVRALAALFAGLVLAELGLRAAGAGYLALASRGGGPETAGGRVLLCVGDSHAFGLYERPEDSYPAQLQGLLDRHAEGAWRVLNRGRPGANSLDVVRGIDAELERSHPAAVLATVGVNDEWTFTGSDPEALPALPWYERLRLAKLARLLAARLGAGWARDVPPSDPEHNPAFETALRRDLRLLREHCTAHGAELMLVAYASDRPALAPANSVLRGLARDDGFALCDATAEVARVESELGFEQTFHLDLHPRAPAYALIARSAYESLRGLGIVRGAAAEPPSSLTPPEVRMRLTGTLGAPAEGPDALVLHIEGGEPGSPFQVILFGLRASGAPPPSDIAVLGGDALLRATLNRDDLSGVFDAGGLAAVPLAPILGEQGLAGLSGRVVQAGYLQHAPGNVRRVTRVPPAVALELR